MAEVALVMWFLTIAGGTYMLMQTLGLSRPSGTAAHSHLPSWLVFTHGGIAVSGVVVWMAFMAYGDQWLAWTSFVILLLVAGLGEVLFTTWFKDRRAIARAERGEEVARVPDAVPRNVPPRTAGDRVHQVRSDATIPVTEMEEQQIPVAAVYGHGLLALVTLVLVLIVAITA